MNIIIRNDIKDENINTLRVHAARIRDTEEFERLREEVMERMTSLKAALREAEQKRIVIAFPQLPPPVDLEGALDFLRIQQRAVEMAIEEHRLASGWRRYVRDLIDQLRATCEHNPGLVEQEAAEAETVLEDPQTHASLPAMELEQSRKLLNFLRWFARREIARHMRRGERVYCTKEAVIQYRQEVRDQARRDAEAVMNERVPFVTDLRLGKRGRERYERIDCKATRSLREQGGIPKIRASARQLYPRLGDVKHYRNHLKAERSRTPDSRRQWRREQRKLTSE